MVVSGTGVPLVTPFAEGEVDHESLRELVGWVESRGVDFLVPCGSTGETPKLAGDERVAVVETVAEAASVPVVAGTGTPGLEPTLDLTERAADTGADAALVVTPHYYGHGRATMERYYRAVADAAPVPVLLYSVPKFTGQALAPETVGRLAAHPNVAGIKDSSGDLDGFQRAMARTPGDFVHLVGAGGIYANALDAGADGGILALANVVPEVASAIGRVHDEDPARAHRLNDAARDLNHAVTAEYGIGELKAGMRYRGASAGVPREPYRPAEDDAVGRVTDLVDRAVDALE